MTGPIEQRDALLPPGPSAGTGVAGGRESAGHVPTDAKNLLAEATPLPWIRPWGRLTVHAPGHDDLFGRGSGPIPTRPSDAITAQSNLDLAVHAVNRLPDYEAAVDALAGMVARWPDDPRQSDGCWPHQCSCGHVASLTEAQAALRRLRGEL